MAARGFGLYPQPPVLAGYREPITVELSPPAGSLGVGPRDNRMCVIRPLGKAESYGQELTRGGGRRGALPPWMGPVAAPARPGPDGSFADLDPDDPTFDQAHAFACVRLVLDVWEGYLGAPVPWYFGRRWLEIGLLDQAYDNGEVGRGWLELGYDVSPDRPPHAFALNLDVIAHEVGHLIVYGLVGEPDPARAGAEYAGFHEAFGDLSALLVAAQLAPVVDQVIERARGNLYGANELNRLAELSTTTQIRIASNNSRMSEFVLGWSDEHDIAEPLTGAVFDLLLDLYQAGLVERGLIPAGLAELSDARGHLRAYAPLIQAEYDRWYPRAPQEFRRAFADARDRLGGWLAHVLRRLRRDEVTYVAVVQALLEADRLTGAGFAQRIEASFAWREIGMVPLGPFLGSRALTSLGRRFGLHRCAKRGISAFRASEPEIGITRRGLMVATRESLLTASAVKLYGRVIFGLTVNVEDARNELGANQFLRQQLAAGAQPRLARIYGFSYFGRYTALARPAIFLVHGRGNLASPRAPSVAQSEQDARENRAGRTGIDPAPGAEPEENLNIPPDTTPPNDLARFNPGPNSVDFSGQAQKCCEFSSDMRVWEYDRGDFSLRLDIDSGPLERILIDAELGSDDTMPYFRGQHTRLRGPGE